MQGKKVHKRDDKFGRLEYRTVSDSAAEPFTAVLSLLRTL